MNLAGTRVKARHDAGIEASEDRITDHDWSLHVVPLAGVRPGDRGIGRTGIGGRNVATGVEPDGTHRPELTVRAGQIDKAVRGDRCRHWDIATAIELPKFLARREV